MDRVAAIAVAALYLSVGSGHAATKETVLYDFTGSTSAGYPVSGLTLSPTGVLYGTSYGGGSAGLGTVFSLTPPKAPATVWTFAVLHSFAGTSGGNPAAKLALDSKGILYGTLSSGGSENDGAVFKLTPPAAGHTGWTESILYNFNSLHGYDAVAPVILDSSGALYGTTEQGGTRQPLVGHSGVVFKLTPPAAGHTVWQETNLYNFAGDQNGGSPVAGLFRDKAGALYGTTQLGGVGFGTVFKLTPPTKGHTAWGFQTLHQFKGGADGAEPVAGVVVDAKGVVYGSTSDQFGSLVGGNPGNGTIFKLTPPAPGKITWTKSLVHRFSGGTDGGLPVSDVVMDAAGALYGTTETGGFIGNGGNSNGNGVVFKLTAPAAGKTTWKETVLYSFAKGSDASDGKNPTAGLTSNGHGEFFGTTNGANAIGQIGAIFSLVL
jgi:hypothetical protein